MEIFPVRIPYFLRKPKNPYRRDFSLRVATLAHNQQWTFRIMITVANARNIRLIVETIITSYAGIAYHVKITLKARRCTTISPYWSVLSVRV